MQLSFVNNLLLLHIRRNAVAPFTSARWLGLLALVTVMAGFSGPFGTLDALPAMQRFVYWAMMVFGTALVGHISGSSIDFLLRHCAWPRIATTLSASALTALPVFCVVVLVMHAFGFRPDATETITLLMQCAVVVTGIACLTSPLSAGSESDSPPDTARLLARLPAGRRGRLVRLQARDHYVEVVTTQGTTLVAMRLRDAIAETTPEPGLQIHRSHWVALHTISGHSPGGIRVCDGAVIPIGRTFRPDLRELGILRSRTPHHGDASRASSEGRRRSPQ